MHAKKVCVSKKIVVFSFIVLGLILSSLYLSQKISSSKLSYRSKAAPPESPQKVVGGTDAKEGQWPFIAKIFTDLTKGENRSIAGCTGTLIAPNWVLTAAHCIYRPDCSGERMPDKAIWLYFGQLNVKTIFEPDLNLNPYYVKRSIVYPKYNPQICGQNVYDDIVLLELDRNVPSDTYTIQLNNNPKMGQEKIDDMYQYGVYVGYGNTDSFMSNNSLKYGIVPIISMDRANKWVSEEFISRNDIATGYPKGGVSACHGDSGGPLLKRVKDRWVQVGIISGNDTWECAKPHSVGKTTKVSSYLSWMNGEIYGYPQWKCSNDGDKCRMDYSQVKGRLQGTFKGEDLDKKDLEEFECRINNGPRPTTLPFQYPCGYELDDDALE